jgi:hypothetical protein
MRESLLQSGKIFVALDAIQGKENKTRFWRYFCLAAKMMTKPEVTEFLGYTIYLALYDQINVKSATFSPASLEPRE